MAYTPEEIKAVIAAATPAEIAKLRAALDAWRRKLGLGPAERSLRFDDQRPAEGPTPGNPGEAMRRAPLRGAAFAAVSKFERQGLSPEAMETVERAARDWDQLRRQSHFKVSAEQFITQRLAQIRK